ncbi:unnamed protein product [Symbiodinium natans]|uniref:Uncharacterized protein n=1 Tax=Symbiodinium natans TaxID=878477 RepID=A0A812SXI9_9DINO|nr:unnamed protein product [Symbiodinium natans]
MAQTSAVSDAFVEILQQQAEQDARCLQTTQPSVGPHSAVLFGACFMCHAARCPQKCLKCPSAPACATSQISPKFSPKYSAKVPGHELAPGSVQACAQLLS